MPKCPECGCYFRIERENILVEPVSTNYIENAMNIAEYFFGERSWEYFKLPYFQFRKLMCQWYSDNIEPQPQASDKITRKRYTSKREKYFEFPEARIAYAMNFCARENSGYKYLKERLVERIDQYGIDENDEFEPFSVKNEVERIKDEFQKIGVLKKERNDMFIGFSKGPSAVSRILILRTVGADKYISISDCPVSDYFPELKESETDEIAEVDK